MIVNPSLLDDPANESQSMSKDILQSKKIKQIRRLKGYMVI